MTYCRVCGVPPNKYRQAYHMDICRTCEINEIRADIIMQAPWWVEYETATEQAMHDILTQASTAVREGLNAPITLGHLAQGILGEDETTVWNHIGE